MGACLKCREALRNAALIPARSYVCTYRVGLPLPGSYSSLERLLVRRYCPLTTQARRLRSRARGVATRFQRGRTEKLATARCGDHAQPIYTSPTQPASWTRPSCFETSACCPPHAPSCDVLLFSKFTDSELVPDLQLQVHVEQLNLKFRRLQFSNFLRQPSQGMRAAIIA